MEGKTIGESLIEPFGTAQAKMRTIRKVAGIGAATTEYELRKMGYKSLNAVLCAVRSARNGPGLDDPDEELEATARGNASGIAWRKGQDPGEAVREICSSDAGRLLGEFLARYEEPRMLSEPEGGKTSVAAGGWRDAAPATYRTAMALLGAAYEAAARDEPKAVEIEMEGHFDIFVFTPQDTYAIRNSRGMAPLPEGTGVTAAEAAARMADDVEAALGAWAPGATDAAAFRRSLLREEIRKIRSLGGAPGSAGSEGAR